MSKWTNMGGEEWIRDDLLLAETRPTTPLRDTWVTHFKVTHSATYNVPVGADIPGMANKAIISALGRIIEKLKAECE